MNKFSIKRTYSFFIIELLIIFSAIFVLILCLNNFYFPVFIQKNNLIDYKTLIEAQMIAINVSNHEFIAYRYDCSQFSQTLVQELKRINISAYCLSGIFRENMGKIALHTWVQMIINGEVINIEATNSQFIDKNTYEAQYFPLVKGFCL